MLWIVYGFKMFVPFKLPEIFELFGDRYHEIYLESLAETEEAHGPYVKRCMNCSYKSYV